LGWLGKMLLIPIKWFFGLGQEHKNPLKLTAGFFYLIGAIFLLLYFAANAAQEHAEKNTKQTAHIISSKAPANKKNK
jgi:hypothetical protein